MRFVDGLDFNSQKGVNVATPTSANDVATKAYVDLGDSGAIGKTLLTVTAGTPGWRNYASQAPLAYSKTADGLVTVEGYVQPGTSATVAGTSYILAVLPVGIRPSDGPEFFPSMAYPSSTTTAAIPCRVSIDGTGNLRIFTPVPVPALAGVTVTGSYMAQQ